MSDPGNPTDNSPGGLSDFPPGAAGSWSPDQVNQQLLDSLKSDPLPSIPSAPAVSAASIDAYLAGKNSPMAGEGANFMKYGRQYNIDPRLFVGLAGAETGFGKNITAGQYNAFNTLYKGHNSPYASWERAINAVGHSLRSPKIGYKLGNTESMYMNNAGTSYCRGPDCKNGLANLNTFMREQGADPNVLYYPDEPEQN